MNGGVGVRTAVLYRPRGFFSGNRCAFQPDVHVSDAMLDRLKTPDRPVELLAVVVWSPLR